MVEIGESYERLRIFDILWRIPFFHHFDLCGVHADAPVEMISPNYLVVLCGTRISCVFGGRLCFKPRSVCA